MHLDCGENPLESTANPTTYLMQSFYHWLEHRVEEVPDSGKLALVIARSGAAGISLDRLCRLTHISPDTLDDLLRALITTGQVVMLKINGQMVYRATM